MLFFANGYLYEASADNSGGLLEVVAKAWMMTSMDATPFLEASSFQPLLLPC
jgi:hypothetical protein